MDIRSEISRIEPDAEEMLLGSLPVLYYRTSTPAHTFESALYVVDGARAVELVARDSFDRDLAAFVLDQVVQHGDSEPDRDRLLMVPTQFPPPWRFDLVVVAPPTIARRFEHESAFLRDRIAWAFPAFAGEFASSDGAREFWRKLRDTDGRDIVVVDWRRPPKGPRA